MAVNSIQLGQVWRSEADGQDYLVTKVYNEVFRSSPCCAPLESPPRCPHGPRKSHEGPARCDLTRIRLHPGRLVLGVILSAANFLYTGIKFSVASPQFSAKPWRF